MINFRADDDLNARLERLAKLTGRSKTFYVREAVTAHIDDLEDIYLADQVMERLESNVETLHSLEDVERELGLERL
ncbi:MAG: TraY domain-containing protein [Proteobacteria bacterium]|nr:TraY domain-containing protein [Pseudomonadota bacterium]